MGNLINLPAPAAPAAPAALAAPAAPCSELTPEQRSAVNQIVTSRLSKDNKRKYEPTLTQKEKTVIELTLQNKRLDEFQKVISEFPKVAEDLKNFLSFVNDLSFKRWPKKKWMGCLLTEDLWNNSKRLKCITQEGSEAMREHCLYKGKMISTEEFALLDYRRYEMLLTSTPRKLKVIKLLIYLTTIEFDSVEDLIQHIGLDVALTLAGLYRLLRMTPDQRSQTQVIVVRSSYGSLMSCINQVNSLKRRAKLAKLMTKKDDLVILWAYTPKHSICKPSLDRMCPLFRFALLYMNMHLNQVKCIFSYATRLFKRAPNPNDVNIIAICIWMANFKTFVRLPSDAYNKYMDRFHLHLVNKEYQDDIAAFCGDDWQAPEEGQSDSDDDNDESESESESDSED